MSDSAHDVIVIGGGPGGYAAALYGASAGLDVAVVEKHKVGGTCLHVGCIPAKELLEAASVYRTVSRATEFGVDAGEPSLDWAAVLERKQRVIDKMMAGLSSVLGQRKVTVYSGVGSLGPSGTVEAAADDGSTQTLSAGSIILASGSAPRTIGGFDVDGELVVTSDELFSISRLPGSAAVIGGGAIGCEFASMMGDLGTKVTVLEALPDILTGCDTEVAKVVRRSFRKRGIEVHTGVTVHGHEPRPDRSGTVVSFAEGRQVDVEMVVVAVGRRPRTEGLGLEAAGVELDGRGFVAVDDRCRTTAPGVWAVGDVVDSPQLAHTAFAEGMLVIRDILGEAPNPARLPRHAVVHLLPSRSGVRRAHRAERGRRRLRRGDVDSPVHGQRAGPDPGRDRGTGEGGRREAGRRYWRSHPRRPYGRAVGDRAVGPGLPGRELGGHRGRRSWSDSTPSDHERTVRRDRAVPDGSLAARVEAEREGAINVRTCEVWSEAVARAARERSEQERE